METSTNSQTSTIIEKCNFNLTVYSDGSNKIFATYKSNGKQLNIKGDKLTNEQVKTLISNANTKFGINPSTIDNGAKLYLNY